MTGGATGWRGTVVAGVAAMLVLAGCASTSATSAPSDTAPIGGSSATSAPAAGGDVPGTTAPSCELPASGTRTVEVGGTVRSYDVVAPAAPAAARSTPTLVLFHGFNSSKEEMAELTGLADQAPAAGVLLVVPQGVGTPSTWNALAGFEQDAAFVDAMLAEVQAPSCVDPEDLWLAGFSAGSAFSAVYGCTHADRVAGLGLVAALAPAICPPDDTPNVVITHGTADLVVPFAGGDQAVGDTEVALGSVSESAARWASRAGCGAEPTVEPVGADVTVTQWSGCTGGSTITFEVVDGGGHAWPGAVRPVAIGPTTQTISSSCVLLAAIADPALDPRPDCPGDGPAAP